MKLLLLLSFGLLAALQTACEQEVVHDPLALNTPFPLQVGEASITVEVALAPHELQRGLMFRDSMAENHGMIFVFAQPDRRSFFMKNTRIPLDIGYFTADGVLREVYPMYPHSLEPVASQREDIGFALEMNQGWFAEQGLTAGAKLDLKLLRAAIQKRGFSPMDYGL